MWTEGNDKRRDLVSRKVPQDVRNFLISFIIGLSRRPLLQEIT